MEPPEALEPEMAEFINDMFAEDDLGSVIRVHIRLESILLQIIELQVAEPKHLRQLNLEFSQQVRLALALGLAEESSKALATLGSLRNDFAHKLNTKLSKQHVNNLYSALSEHQKTQVQNTFQQFRATETVLKKYSKFSDSSVRIQFTLIAAVLWANLMGEKSLLARRRA